MFEEIDLRQNQRAAFNASELKEKGHEQIDATQVIKPIRATRRCAILALIQRNDVVPTSEAISQ